MADMHPKNGTQDVEVYLGHYQTSMIELFCKNS